MNQERTQTPFTLEPTLDGSLTLKMSEDGEWMHHSGGAALETQYIYKTPIEWALNQLQNCHLHVVGLGIGYIEISWAIELIKANKLKKVESSLTSFEIEPRLVQDFSNWLSGQNITQQVKTTVYDDICKHLDSTVAISEIKKIISDNLLANKIKGDLLLEYKNSQKANIICFDAFSNKTNQELWSADFLDKYIKTCADENCVFTTYGCTGVLKRTLKDNGFKMHERLRFKGKSDSTFAVRGIFKDAETPYRTS